MNDTTMKPLPLNDKRRSAPRMFIVGLVITLIPSSGMFGFTQKRRSAVKPSFSYSKAAALLFKEESVTQKEGVLIRDVSYAAYTKDRRIRAYVVRPVGKGPFAGVLFFHWLGEPNGDRNEFLNEAVELAKRGTVSLLIQGHFPWKIQPTNGESDRRLVVNETIEVRRALDLLLLQHGVDRERIGFVGHDYGAMYGSILSGIDKRVKAYVFVAGMGNFGDWSLKYWKGPSANGADTYMRLMDPVDPINYVSRAAPANLMFQFSNADKYISRTTADAYYGAASQPKQVRWYETDHAMNTDAVRKDRSDWLTRQLRLSARSQ
ncbi:MAG TPA: hypothetical protein VNO50_10220 [Pyrinomonadaceae bacterium]|nr:hypothetical protein [Pyrinomonadaceae bacterium]